MPPGECTLQLGLAGLLHKMAFSGFAGPVEPTGIANCPLGKVLNYKYLIYLFNLQFPFFHYSRNIRKKKHH